MADDKVRSQSQHLAWLCERLDANDLRVTDLTSGLSDEQLLWKPAPDKWGIADCLEHIITTDDAYVRTVKPVIDSDAVPTSEEARANRAALFRPTMFARWGLKLASPDGPKLPAPGTFTPPPARADAPARYFKSQDEWRELLSRLDGHDIAKLKVKSPVTSLVQLRMGSMLEVMIAHQERHVAQAERVRSTPGFPASGLPALG